MNLVWQITVKEITQSHFQFSSFVLKMFCITIPSLSIWYICASRPFQALTSTKLHCRCLPCFQSLRTTSSACAASWPPTSTRSTRRLTECAAACLFTSWQMMMESSARGRWPILKRMGAKKKGLKETRSSKAKGEKGFSQPLQYLCQGVLSSWQTLLWVSNIDHFLIPKLQRCTNSCGLYF